MALLSLFFLRLICLPMLLKTVWFVYTIATCGDIATVADTIFCL